MSQDSRIQLQEGIAAARSGDRTTARRLLREVVEQEPNNEMAWIWLASVVGSVAERRACLQRVLQINPSNQTAREALNQLGQEGEATGGGRQRRQSGGGNFINILIALLFIVVVIGGLLLFSSVGPLGNNDDPVVLLSSPTPPPPTSTPRPPEPTRTPNLFRGTSGAPTLPPTFTPTPTPFPSTTPTPTATPFPLEQFRAIVSSQELGQSQPDAYFYSGDGSNEQLLGYEMRDVAYSPDGEFIAFIRDVDYSGSIVVPPANAAQNPEATDEAAPELPIYPELFIAGIGDVANAQQITELKTSIVASPTWSPDGKEIVFVNNYNGSEDLWYITPDGGNLRRLTLNDNIIDRDPAWRPVLGSREILFASDRDSIGSTAIYRFELTEPGVDPVYERVTVSDRSNYAPAWSSDGDYFTFVSDRSGDADIYVTDYDGALTTQLTFDDNGAEDRSPTFTPDNRFVAFVSNRADDHFQSYLISLDGTILIRLTNTERDDISITYRPELILRLINQEANR